MRVVILSEWGCESREIPRRAVVLQRRLINRSFKALSLKFAHIVALERQVEFFADHKDPFDRILIAQALAERLPIMTSDRHFERYNGLQVIAV